MRHLLKGSRRAGLLLAVPLLALAACDRAVPPEPSEKPTLGLMTSLPILWAGNDAFASLAEEQEESHWAKTALEARYTIDPVDALTDEALKKLEVLVLAQPRALSPEENVALDAWVRAGGRVLLFADPQLVGDYEYPLGDPRRPMDTALLSPILARWGLELVQGEGRVEILDFGGSEMTIAAAGTFRQIPADGSACTVTLEDVLASCAIGKGQVVVLADATLVEDPVGGTGSPDALDALLGMTQGGHGDEAGKSRE